LKLKNDMVVSYVLINTEPTYEYKVYNALRKIPRIIELHPLFGEYDFIAKIESNNFEGLGDIVLNTIRSVKGVIDTKTLTGTKI
jgi:DNA-binding Lrp family transcriptional regulator